MGYETTAIFVTRGHRKNFKGYCRIEATLEMGKICYGFIGALITKKERPKKEKEELKKQVREWEKQYDYCFTKDGDYTEELEGVSEYKRKIQTKKLYRLEEKLEKKLPYIHHRSNRETFEDSYGDLLIIVDLNELRTAIIKAQARLISQKEYETGYRKFDIAIRMIEMFMDKNNWGDEGVKVILWGH